MSQRTEQENCKRMTNQQALNNMRIRQYIAQERLKDACREENRDFAWAVRLANKVSKPLKCLEVARALHELDLEVTRLGLSNPNEEYDSRYFEVGKRHTVGTDALTAVEANSEPSGKGDQHGL